MFKKKRNCLDCDGCPFDSPPPQTKQADPVKLIRGVDTCVICGQYVPEGRHVCIICESKEERQRSGTSPSGALGAKYYDTIAVDFDGTLCENSFPDIGQAKTLVIEYIKRQAERGAKIILHTCRENGTRRALLDEAIAFCREHGIPLYAINENPGNQYAEEYGTGADGRKVFADLYIDDRATNTADIETLMERERRIPL